MKYAFLGLAAVALLSIGVIAADEKKEEKFGKCPVSGKTALEDKFVDYKGAKVYFCCPGCPDGFKADTAKFATKANQQLVVTKQATQAKCPLSGGKLNPDTGVDVGGVSVTFCCNNCKGKVAKATGDEQLELVFSDAAFGKGFEVKKAKLGDKE
jgi:hypothetical protein